MAGLSSVDSEALLLASTVALVKVSLNVVGAMRIKRLLESVVGTVAAIVVGVLKQVVTRLWSIMK